MSGASVIAAIKCGERAGALALLRELRRRIGYVKAARALASVGLARLRGEPFAALGPPLDERERLSRRQCGDVVLVDRAVCALADEQTAFEVARAAVLGGAMPFMDAMLPTSVLSSAVSSESSSESSSELPMTDALAGLVPKLADSFFNAEGEGGMQADGSFRFEVRRCRFVELLQQVGAGHLAPLFCEADELFFDGVRRPVKLHRTQTIAAGGSSCDFRFTVD